MSVLTDTHEMLRFAKDHGIEKVLVSFSGGKDSLAILDLCAQHFHVEGVFWQLVKGLRCEEIFLRYAESRWNITIHRIPSMWCIGLLRSGKYSRQWFGVESIQAVEQKDIELAMRKRLGDEFWFSYGMRKSDSAEQHSWLSKVCGFGTVDRGICCKSRRLYPIANWKQKDVVAYLKMRKIALPDMMGQRTVSGVGLVPEVMRYIRKRYPDDWEKIKRLYPGVVAHDFREDHFGHVEELFRRKRKTNGKENAASGDSGSGNGDHSGSTEQGSEPCEAPTI